MAVGGGGGGPRHQVKADLPRFPRYYAGNRVAPGEGAPREGGPEAAVRGSTLIPLPQL